MAVILAQAHKIGHSNDKLADELSVIEGQKKWLRAAGSHEAAGNYKSARDCAAQLLK